MDTKRLIICTDVRRQRYVPLQWSDLEELVISACAQVDQESQGQWDDEHYVLAVRSCIEDAAGLAARPKDIAVILADLEKGRQEALAMLEGQCGHEPWKGQKSARRRAKSNGG